MIKYIQTTTSVAAGYAIVKAPWKAKAVTATTIAAAAFGSPEGVSKGIRSIVYGQEQPITQEAVDNAYGLNEWLDSLSDDELARLHDGVKNQMTSAQEITTFNNIEAAKITPENTAIKAKKI